MLFIDARKLGRMVDRTHRELTGDDIARIADAYHAWRGKENSGEYADVPGFCKSAALEEIRRHGHVLTPGRYVGAEPQEDDGEPFEEKMARLSAQWREQQAEAQRLDAAIEENLTRLGFGTLGDSLMKLDLTPLEDAVAQLEEALDIYHSDLALTDSASQEASEGGRNSGVRVHLRALLQNVAGAISSLHQPIRQRSTSSSSMTLYVKPTGNLCSDPNSLSGLSFAGTVGRPATPTTKRKLRRCSRAFPNFLQEARYLLNRLHERIESFD